MKNQIKLLLASSLGASLFLLSSVALAHTANIESINNISNINAFSLTSKLAQNSQNYNELSNGKNINDNNTNTNDSTTNDSLGNNNSSDNNHFSDSYTVHLIGDETLIGPKEILEVVAKIYQEQLPKNVFDGLILDSVKSHDDTIEFNYQFTTLETAKLTSKFYLVMNTYLTEQTCSTGDEESSNSTNFLSLLSQGAHFKYNLYDKNKKLIHTFDQDIHKCFTDFEEDK